MRIQIAAAVAAIGIIASSQAGSAPASAKTFARQCITDALAWHAKHPGDALPMSCAKVPGAETGDYTTQITGNWDGFRVEATASDGMKTVVSSTGDQSAAPSARMKMSEKICVPDHTFCCTWEDDKHPPRCGPNTGGPL